MKKRIRIFSVQVLLAFLLLIPEKLVSEPEHSTNRLVSSVDAINSSGYIPTAFYFLHSGRAVNAKALIRTKALREKLFFLITIPYVSYKLPANVILKHSYLYHTYTVNISITNNFERGPPIMSQLA
jgi:hypothetical protein